MAQNRLNILILLIIVLLFSVKYAFSDKSYEKDYFVKAGIKGSFGYEDVINSVGRPLKEEVDLRDLDYAWMTAYYEDFILTFSKLKELDKDRYILQNVRVTSPKIRFGKKKIGVGSSFDEVKSAYKKVRPIVDDECGYIDHSTWVVFEFDEKKKVKCIVLFSRP